MTGDWAAAGPACTRRSTEQHGAARGSSTAQRQRSSGRTNRTPVSAAQRGKAATKSHTTTYTITHNHTTTTTKLHNHTEPHNHNDTTTQPHNHTATQPHSHTATQPHNRTATQPPQPGEGGNGRMDEIPGHQVERAMEVGSGWAGGRTGGRVRGHDPNSTRTCRYARSPSPSPLTQGQGHGQGHRDPGTAPSPSIKHQYQHQHQHQHQSPAPGRRTVARRGRGRCPPSACRWFHRSLTARRA